MTLVLGLDTAWTELGPSGVALVDASGTRSHVIAIAPGYDPFIEMAATRPVDWRRNFKGCNPVIPKLLDAAKVLAGKSVDVIAVDMPLSLKPISARRMADDAISKVFGGKGCSTHSPSADRPGPISEAIRKSASEMGYQLVTTRENKPAKALLETYPHPAILALTAAPYRLPYKMQRARKYWPDLSPDQRRIKIVESLLHIAQSLKAYLGEFQLDLDDLTSSASLKRAEDAIDALVCCWVGCRWAIGAAYPYGDEFSAIWVPTPVEAFKP